MSRSYLCVSPRNALTGGAEGALDESDFYDATLTTTGDVALVFLADETVVFKWNASSGQVDDGINYITPVGYGGIGRWERTTEFKDEDLLSYIDGTRPFTGTVGGVTPVADSDLATKGYTDDAITTATGALTTDHGSLLGLGDDDHSQYILVDGTRAFSSTVSGVTPTLDPHLATKGYTDAAITTATGALTTDHGSLLGLG